ncbi:uncharacterized protein LOC104884895 [Beta vulgaris subsp. vulgaris]|uniref:uncharacterized protein LOC104884895 n=1 Tax=Beta vulgaris subsp. vulgaris TaxID=3555 RepID=UPI00053F8989|nr:uncharacterized protein LOC104884895 [Beta vulgaris subsp. vulgaris]
MAIPARLSWALKKILASRETIQEAHSQHVYDADCFSIKKLCRALKGDQPTMQWRRIICNNRASPKALFITWLMLHNRLATKSRLYEWRILTDTTCVMCSDASETVSHLFFECPTSKQICTLCLQQIGITNHHRGLAEEVKVVAAKGHSKRPQNRLLLMFFAEVVYHIWQQRNLVFLEGLG